MKRLRTASLLLAAALAGCSHPAEPLDLPDPATVKVFDIYVWEDDDIVNQRFISDPRRIAEIFTLLEEANDTEYRRGRFDWPWFDGYTIDVWGTQDFYLLVEEGWFGGSERDRWPAGHRERRMSGSEWERLVALLAKGD